MGTRGAGVLWVVSALAYVGAEAVAASAFPGYSYARNYISDLGVPEVGVFQGRAIDSPLHAVMNAGFLLQGALYLAAAVTTVRAARGGSRGLFLSLAVVYAVGIAVVGLVHGSSASAQNGIGGLHVVGAAMAIVGGNAASIVAGAAARRGRAPWALETVGIVLGAAGLLALLMLQVDTRVPGVDLLPDGVWERASVYAVTAWQLATGLRLLRRPEVPRQPRPPQTAGSGAQVRSAVHRLFQLGIRIPEALSVVVFDDNPWSELVTPPLNVVRQPIDMLARHSVELVLARMQGRLPEAPQHIEVQADLVIRSSCAAPPRR
ncbi:MULTISPECIES: DUF998 domain-containing protein [unclassified Rathayibacter]|uniref:DUF998 domain-containing protein n=1 Tax=unclassified Rathayibacter TaxID=2609250 RepID=UPI0021577695|nr:MULTISPECIES: DUF998 domain-containing protein [unclassified Rathayibacter]